MENHTKQPTLRRYETLLTRYVNPTYGEDDIGTLTEQELASFSEVLKVSLADRTVSYIITTTRRVRDSFIEDIRYTKPRRTGINHKVTVETLTEENVKKLNSVLLFSINPTTFGIMFCLHLGIRLGEMCALRREDFTTDALKVGRTIQRIRRADTSGGRSKTERIIVEYENNDPRHRVIPLTKGIQKALRSESIARKGLLISDDGTKTIDSRTMENRLKKIAEPLKIDKVSFNILRDTFAVHCIKAGIDIVTMSRLLGHTNVGVTGSRYGDKYKECEKKVNVVGW